MWCARWLATSKRRDGFPFGQLIARALRLKMQMIVAHLHEMLKPARTEPFYSGSSVIYEVVAKPG